MQEPDYTCPFSVTLSNVTVTSTIAARSPGWVSAERQCRHPRTCIRKPSGAQVGPQSTESGVEVVCPHPVGLSTMVPLPSGDLHGADARRARHAQRESVRGACFGQALAQSLFELP